MFRIGHDSVSPITLLEQLRSYFTNPTEITSLTDQYSFAYSAGKDLHAGSGPNASMSFSAKIEVGVYVVYEPYVWPRAFEKCCFYHPNWVQDVANSVYWLFSNETGKYTGPDCVGSYARLEKGYLRTTKNKQFYINYGRPKMVTINKRAALVAQITGGEGRSATMYVIPVFAP